MSKLMFRAFPNHFQQNSIYAHFPFVIPSENRVIHEALGTADKYSWDRPKRKGEIVFIRSHKAAMGILSNKKDFKVTWGESIFHATSPAGGDISRGFCLAGDKDANAANRTRIIKSLYQPPHWADEMRAFCDTKTSQLLKKYSIPLMVDGKVTYEVDIVRDVFSLTTTHIMAEMFSLPLKTTSNPHGIYSEQELFGVFFAIFASIFFDADVANSFKLREIAQALTQQLGGLVTLNAKAGILADIAKSVEDALHANGTAPEPALPSYGNAIIRHMVEMEGSVENAVWGSILMAACAGVANQTQLLSQALGYYLGPGSTHLSELHRLAHLHTKEADDTLMK